MYRPDRFPPPRLLLPALLVLLAACSDRGGPVGPDGGVGPVENVSFSSDVQPIFNASCTFSGCHDASASGGLRLTAGSSLAQLVGVASPQYPGWIRVVAGRPDSSLVYRKLTLIEVFSPTLGFRMPKDNAPLSTHDVDIVRVWIEEGAKDN